jgi:hypothetical protein
MVMEEIHREDAAARRPKGMVTGITDFLIHVIVAGADPLIICLSLLATFMGLSFSKSRRSTFVIGALTGCLIAMLVGTLDYFAHHHDGVTMSRSVSFDLPMQMTGAFAAALIEVLVFSELAGFVRRALHKKPNVSKEQP